MASLSLTNATIYGAGYDWTTDANKLQVVSSVDELDNTTFGGGGYKSRLGGLRDATAELDGFWQSAATSGAPDPEAFLSLGTADQAWIFSPTGVATDPCYLAQLGKFKYETFDQVGAMMPFKLNMSGTNSQGLVRGQLAKAKGNVSATGQLGSILTMTGPSATQYVYGALELFGTPGTTITVKIQSATLVGFGSPTDRITIGPITTAGGTWATRLIGPVTDGFWRMTVSGITGTWSVAAAIGIG